MCVLSGQAHRPESSTGSERSPDLIDFDLFQYFRFVVNNNTVLGFSNDTSACFSSATMMFSAVCAAGANFDQFVFFDEVHPTARMHERVGRALFAALPGGVNID